ncbi:hypothetical protein ABZ372_52170, partial [Streptomyces sp. NPDC005921]
VAVGLMTLFVGLSMAEICSAYPTSAGLYFWAQIRKWRELAAERGLSLRELATEVAPGHPSFVGTPSSVADEWTRYVTTGAADGFNIVPDLLPSSVTDIVDKLVPELQSRGVYPTEYRGTTLREHLQLPPLPTARPN